MTDLIDRVRARAFEHQSSVILTDGHDARVIAAAEYLSNHSAIRPILFGDRTIIGRNLGRKIEVYDPSDDDRQALITNAARQNARLRDDADKQGKTVEDVSRESVICGGLLVAEGLIDGMVGGATIPTGQLIRAGIRTVGVAAESPLVTGAFVMILKEPLAAGQTALVFIDAAVVPNPSEEQLAIMALHGAEIARNVADIEPVVAFLSFSTKGSAQDESIQALRNAVDRVRALRPELRVDGELQADAALVPDIGQRKAPDSMVAGHSNVLVFPNLASGNIAYKLVQRIAGATALGVVLSGFRRPVNDLSRGCDVDDVINMAAITVLQSLREGKS